MKVIHLGAAGKQAGYRLSVPDSNGMTVICK